MIEYTLTRRRGMKNLRMRICGDGSVAVSAPPYVPKSEIDKFVESRRDWIEESRRAVLLRNEAVPVCPGNGGFLTLFGCRYNVEIIDDNKLCGQYEQKGDKLVLFKSHEQENGEQAAVSFMADNARRAATAAVEKYLRLSGYKGGGIHLKLKYMKSRWGSCSRNTNTITLNLALCKLPPEYLEYVAAHEVTHLFVSGHSDEFYRFGEDIYNGFFETDRRLNRLKPQPLFG